MIKEKYKSFSEFEKDYKIYLKNPQDRHLISAIDKRTKNSSKKVQEQVHVFLQSLLLETDPYSVFAAIMMEVGPEYSLILRTKEDPWFEV